MKKNKLLFFLFVLSICANLFFITQYSSDIYFYARFWITKWMGFSSATNLPKFERNLQLVDYSPVPIIDISDKRTNKLPSYPIIETHGHLGKHFNTNPQAVSKQLEELNIQYFINLSFTTGDDYLSLKKEYSDPKIIHFSTFNWKYLNDKDPDWVNKMLGDLKQDIKNGSKGIKLWKNLGLSLKKIDGQRLKINDPELFPLLEECQKENLIISIHTADPKSFFDPIDRYNERYEELLRRPDWSFSSKEFPTRNEVLSERNHLFQKFPKLTFIALHLAEMYEDLDSVAKLLDENPNVYVDIAARVDELGRQPYKARDFIIKYQGRILFGTDGPPDKGKLEVYSRFLETKDEYFSYSPPHKSRKGFWQIYGIYLDKEVLEKIYYKNAKKLFNLN